MYSKTILAVFFMLVNFSLPLCFADDGSISDALDTLNMMKYGPKEQTSSSKPQSKKQNTPYTIHTYIPDDPVPYIPAPSISIPKIKLPHHKKTKKPSKVDSNNGWHAKPKNAQAPTSAKQEAMQDQGTAAIQQEIGDLYQEPTPAYHQQKTPDAINDIYQEPSSASYQQKPASPAEKKSHESTPDMDTDTVYGTIAGEDIFEEQQNIYEETDDSEAIEGNAGLAENSDEGAGVLHKGLKLLEKVSEKVLGPFGKILGSLFGTGAEIAKTGTDKVDDYVTTELQGEAQGLKKVSTSGKLFDFINQNAQEYNKHNYFRGYKLTFEDENGDDQTVDFDAIGATKVNLNGEDYYVFTTTDGTISKALIKIEDEPFWKFWKSDKAKVYKADIDGDIESGQYSIQNAQLLGTKEID